MQKPPRSKTVRDTNEGIPSSERAKYEKRMTKGKELEVGNLLNILPKGHYTLLITNDMYDDMSYKYPQIEKMVKDFAELTLAPLWRIVIFHSMGQ